MTNLVASGEVPLALTVYQYSVEEAKKSGAPIVWFVIDSAVATFGAMAIPKKAPHPHAAILFYDYMISAEGQSIIAKIGYPTTNLKVKSPIGNVKLKFLDPGSLIDGEEKSNTRFESILRNNKNYRAPRALILPNRPTRSQYADLVAVATGPRRLVELLRPSLRITLAPG